MNHAQNRKIKIDKKVNYGEPDIDMDDEDVFDELDNKMLGGNYSTTNFGESRASSWLNTNNKARNSSIE